MSAAQALALENVHKSFGRLEVLSIDYLVGLCAKAGVGVDLRLAA